jgi:hypothetical protein
MMRAPEAFTVASELAEDIIRLQEIPELPTIVFEVDRLAGWIKRSPARSPVNLEAEDMPTVEIDRAIAPFRGVRTCDVNDVTVASGPLTIQLFVARKQNDLFGLRRDVVAIDSNVTRLATFVEDSHTKTGRNRREGRTRNSAEGFPFLIWFAVELKPAACGPNRAFGRNARRIGGCRSVKPAQCERGCKQDGMCFGHGGAPRFVAHFAI